MMEYRLIVVALLSLGMVAGSAMAADPPPGAASSGAVVAKEGWYTNLVNFEFMREHAQIPPKEGVTIIDARPAARKYDVGHIPGAINIPETQFDKHVEKLPADKNALLIFYCDGTACMLSHKAAFKAENLGYSNIKVYPHGFPEWASQDMNVAVSASYIKKQLDEKGSAVLIDARPARKFAKGTIPTAINIPETKFDQNVAKLPADKEVQLIFFCGGLQCRLSDKAATKAKALGYRNVVTYPAGYPEWEKLFGTPAAIAMESGKEKGSISVSSFEKIMKERPDSILVIDVRDEAEYKSAAISGSINIPMDQLEKKIDALPVGKPIVFVCGTGARAGEAYDTVVLLRNELDSWFIDAETVFHADGGFTIKPEQGAPRH